MYVEDLDGVYVHCRRARCERVGEENDEKGDLHNSVVGLDDTSQIGLDAFHFVMELVVDRPRPIGFEKDRIGRVRLVVDFRFGIVDRDRMEENDRERVELDEVQLGVLVQPLKLRNLLEVGDQPHGGEEDRDAEEFDR